MTDTAKNALMSLAANDALISLPKAQEHWVDMMFEKWWQEYVLYSGEAFDETDSRPVEVRLAKGRMKTGFRAGVWELLKLQCG